MSKRHIALFALPVLALGLAFVGLATAGVARAGAAFVGHHGPFHGGSPEEHRAHVELVIDRALDRVDATDDQRDAIDAIVDDTFAELLALHDGHEEHHDQLKALLGEETIDREALEALRVDGMDRFDEGSQLLLGAFADIADVLTVEQREALIEFAERRCGR